MKMTITRILYAVTFLLLFTAVKAQNVGVNETGAAPDVSAMLDVNSVTKGLLAPRMTKTQKQGIPAPANGLLVYQTDDTIGFWYYDLNTWKPLIYSQVNINIGTGTGLTGGPITGTGTISLANTGVTAGTYGNGREVPIVTVNAQGQLTGVSTITISELDSVIGNELADTSTGGFLQKQGNGTAANPFTVGMKPGTAAGQFLYWNGSQWQPIILSGGAGISISGNRISNTGDTDSTDDVTSNTAAGGDLSGNYPDPLVARIQGRAVSANAPAVGQVLQWNGSQWEPTTIAAITEKDSVIGNEVSDTISGGFLNKTGTGTTADPYKLGLKNGTAAGQYLMWDGSKWSTVLPSYPAEKDSVIGNEISDTTNTYNFLVKSGNGTSANPYKIGVKPGTIASQFLMWNGSQWIPAAINIPAEKDSVIGNEFRDTITGGFINYTGSGTTADPLRIGLKPGSATGEVLTWDGAKWIAQSPGALTENDGVIGNEVSDTITGGFLNKTGSGTTADPYKLGLKSGNISGQYLMWNGTQWVPAMIVLPAEKDSVIGNEISDTVNTYGLISKTGSGTVADPYKISGVAGSVSGHVLTWNGSRWVSQSPGTLVEVDSVIGNELADTLTGGFLQKTGNGTTANPYRIGLRSGSTTGDVITWDGTKWVSQSPGALTENDGVIGNEVSDTITGGFLDKTGSGTTADPYKLGLKGGTTSGEYLMWDGAQWVPTVINFPAEQDSIVGNELKDTLDARGFLVRSGNGTTANPYRIGVLAGGSTGDVLTWDGTKWVSQSPGALTENDGIIGNEVSDTITGGFLDKTGSGTTADPYKLGLKNGNTSGQYLMWNGTQWVPQNISHPAEQDSVIGNEFSDTINAYGLITKTGAGTAGNPYKIAVVPGANTGEVLTWDGTKWVSQSPGALTENDGVIGNEVSDTITGGFLAKTGSGTTTDPYKLGLKDGNTSGEYLMWNGTTWIPTTIVFPAEKDSVIGNELADTLSNGFINKTGSGTTASPYRIGLKSGSTTGDVLTWDGTKWVSQSPGALTENDGIIGNEVSDTITGGFLDKTGSGTTADPYKLGLKSGSASGQYLMWDGTKWVSAIITFPAEKDSVIGNEFTDTINSYGLITKSGSGTAADPYKISAVPGTTTGHVLTWNGSRWVSQSPGSFTEVDSVIGNELKDTLNARGFLLRSGNGTTANPYRIGVLAGNTTGDVLTWNGTAWVSQSPGALTENDGIIGNEVSDTITGGFLDKTGSGTTADPYKLGLKNGNTSGEYLMWNGTQWISTTITFPSEKDSVIGNEFSDTINAYGMITKSGSGTTADPYKISAVPGTSSGQILTWNGSRWISQTPAVEKDSVIGNELKDTVNARGFLTRTGAGTTANPYRIGVNAGTTTGHVLTWNGSQWVSQAPATLTEVDGVIGNEVSDTISGGFLNKTGSGTAADPYKLGLKGGSSSGQYLMWDGTQWVPATITHPAEQDSVIGNEITDTLNARGLLVRSGTGTAANPYRIGVIPGTNTNQYLRWNGSQWIPSTVTFTEKDSIVGNEFSDTLLNGFITYTGSGTTASPKIIGLKPGTAAGQVITWDGTKWVADSLDTDSLDWNLLGNSGTNASVNFVGTTDDQALSFRTKDTLRMQLRTDGGLELYSDDSSVFIGRDAGMNNTTGKMNVFVGTNTGISNTTGSQNIFIGRDAGSDNTTGSRNVAIGDSTLTKIVTGSLHVAIGDKALKNLTDAAWSTTAVGVEAVEELTTGRFNVGFGYRALRKTTVGEWNTAIGVGTIENNTHGSANTALGLQSMIYSKKASHNIAIGYQAMLAQGDTTSFASAYNAFNMAIGNYALYYTNGDSTANGNYNTAIGHYANAYNRKGRNNVAVGHGANYLKEYQSRNVAVGDFALYGAGFSFANGGVPYNTNNVGVGYYAAANTYQTAADNGQRNVAVGTAALRTNYTGSGNTAIGDSALFSNTNWDNTAVGSKALLNNNGGYWNTAIGSESQAYNVSGYMNTSIGYRSLRYNTGGYFNTAVGTGALEFNDSGYFNTAIGRGALFNNTQSGENIAIGVWALSNLNYQDSVLYYTRNIAIGNYAMNNTNPTSRTNGYWNIAVGQHVMYNNTTGIDNAAFGHNALYNNRSGARNIAMGHNALASYSYNPSKPSGYHYSNNVAIGYNSQYLTNATADTNGMYNVSMGNYSMYANTRGFSNVVIGDSAFYSNGISSENVVIGKRAARSYSTNLTNVYDGLVVIGANALASQGVTTAGPNNTMAIGRRALYLSTSTHNNIAIGNNSMFGIGSGSENTAVGIETLVDTAFSVKGITVMGYRGMYNNTGSYNTGIGDSVLFANTYGSQNTAIGAFAMKNNTIYSYSTAVGYAALSNITFSAYHAAFGAHALYNNTTGFYNSAFGMSSMYTNTVGGENTALGYVSLYYNDSGRYNTAVGVGALYYNTRGDYNVGIGEFSGLSTQTTGDSNVYIGYYARPNGTYNNAIALGTGAIVTATRQARIGNPYMLSIGGYQNWTNASDSRIKKQVKENVPGLEFILKLRPVTYVLDIKSIYDNFLGNDEILKLDSTNGEIIREVKKEIQPAESELRTGFIAQEVEAAAKSVGYDFSGVDRPKNEKDLYGLRYAEFVVPLVKAIQEQQQQIDDMKKIIAEQQKMLEQLLKK